MKSRSLRDFSQGANTLSATSGGAASASHGVEGTISRAFTPQALPYARNWSLRQNHLFRRGAGPLNALRPDCGSTNSHTAHCPALSLWAADTPTFPPQTCVPASSPGKHPAVFPQKADSHAAQQNHTRAFSHLLGVRKKPQVGQPAPSSLCPFTDSKGKLWLGRRRARDHLPIGLRVAPPLTVLCGQFK